MLTHRRSTLHRIKSTGVKMVMSGEGADEMLGGYLYFHKAPNAVEFHEENVAKLNDLCALRDCYPKFQR
eukprot:COSAG06_NODE_14501_length_1151_cov_0.949620_2_plen_69_part_00